ncbi:uncharacterized protein LOC134283957 [Aedes albopictus]|uniref:Peptidase aspartic putative domain-containing protein n=1 Tax=Aedes albopictus TaxID=7160 RepID=A0ABM1YPG5_AEDAL
MTDITALVHQRGQAKAQVTKIRKALEGMAGAGSTAPSTAMLAVYSKKLDRFYSEYREYHNQIVAVIPDDHLNEQIEAYDLFETQHTETCVLLETIVQSISDVAQPRAQANTQQQPDPPRIIVQQQPLKAPIPPFDGKPENWPRFKAMFLDVMRTSADSDAIKLYHLDRALVGTAAGIIDSRTLSQNDYKHAWKILEDRYEDKRVIVDVHINGLLALPKVHRENAKELRALIDEELPEYEDTIEFLKKRCAVLERVEASLAKQASTSKTSVAAKNPGHQPKNATSKTYAVTTKDRTCELCGTGNHPVYKCEAFREMTVAHRQAKSAPTVSCSMKQMPRVCNSLLMTARVQVKDVNGNLKSCRALLDCGSQAHLVSKRFVESLSLPCFSTKVDVVGANGQQSSISEMVNLELRSCYSDFRGQLQCLVADPEFYKPGDVDLLIGVQLFFALLMPGQFKIAENLPVLQETRLGWVVAGSIDDVGSPRVEQHCYTTSLQNLSETMEKFWSVESVDSCELLTGEEQLCEEIFCSTTRRDQSGRYIVQLPLKESVFQMESNRSIALRRFFMMEQRFQKDPELKKLYVEFINEYKTLNHCEPIDESQDPPNLVKYYLPHHAVLKPSSSSTKLRVVFDASSKAKGPSLNDCLMIGPVVQNDLFSIILRFRKHRYVFSADISKMYRQIQVDRIHTPLLRIFWRENPTDPLQVLELTTVTYGTSAAPFLATRSLQQLAFDESTRYPFAAQIVLEDFYVDDALTGAETVEEAIQRRVELTEILSCGGFPIHKWCSNEPAILETVPEKDREQFLSFEDSDINQAIKTLGLLWDPAEDVYRFRLDLPSLGDCSPTKRNVLSQIAKIFDPLGLISPVVVFAKIIMQQIWMSKLKWDDVLDGKLLQAWIVFRDTLNHIHEIKIPRFFGAVNPVRYEIHGFADASSVAYGACLYIRVITQDGVKVSLVCSKSKVVPIKGLTIPRSELCAALLLVRLFLKVYPAVKMEFESVHFWSDSQIVLAWLRKPLPQLNLFVRNRVSEIVEGSSGADWNYVKSAENPADVVSRGQPPQLLVSNELWWHGPQFLRSRTYRVDEPVLISDDELPEWSPVTNTSAVSVPEPLPVMTAFGSFRKLQRVIAYVRRFVRNARSAKSQRITSRYLTVQEMRESMNVIVKYIQRSEFADEIGRLELK